jgi:hypothetical protein
MDIISMQDPNRVTCWEEYEVNWDTDGGDSTRVNAWELELAEGWDSGWGVRGFMFPQLQEDRNGIELLLHA